MIAGSWGVGPLRDRQSFLDPPVLLMTQLTRVSKNLKLSPHTCPPDRRLAESRLASVVLLAMEIQIEVNIPVSGYMYGCRTE